MTSVGDDSGEIPSEACMRVQSMIDRLEPRAMLSANASVVRDTLFIDGDLRSSNAITVGNDGSGGVKVLITSVDKNGVTKTFSATFPTSLGFSRVSILGGVKADSITIDQSVSPFTFKTRVASLEGNDTINAGDEADIIFAGAGDDKVNAGAGDDVVH